MTEVPEGRMLRVYQDTGNVGVRRHHETDISGRRNDFRQEFGVDERHRHSRDNVICIRVHELFASFTAHPILRDNGELSAPQHAEGIELKANHLKRRADVIGGKISACA